VTDDPRHDPTEVRAPRGARVLEIDWADGFRGRVPHEVLRGFCPCAQCQGHDGPIRFVGGGASAAGLELSDIREVGQYAVQLVWGDGHQTGIYSFGHLRRLCEIPGDPSKRTLPR
jgi:DUF971 family protein